MKKHNLILRICVFAVIFSTLILDLLSFWIKDLNYSGVVLLNISVIILLIVILYMKNNSYKAVSIAYEQQNETLKGKDYQIHIRDKKISEYESTILALNTQITRLSSQITILETRNQELLNQNKELQDNLDNAIEKKYRCVLEYLSNTWHDADTFDEKDRIFTKKQVERLLKSLNYCFVDYSDETKSYYQTEYSDENEVIITKRAIENISTHQVAIKGIAYIPHL